MQKLKSYISITDNGLDSFTKLVELDEIIGYI